jgi:hypothetical protein
MASAGSLHPQVDVINYNEGTRRKVMLANIGPLPTIKCWGAMENISDIWERPPDRHLHVVGCNT